MKALFEKYEDDSFKFWGVEHKMSQRADLHALMMLDKLDGSGGEALASSDYDVVYLTFDPDVVFKNATEDQIHDLVRCGLRFDGDGFSFFI
jgi:hypothetical protein